MNGQTTHLSQPDVSPSFGMLSTGKFNAASVAVAAGVNVTIILLAILLAYTAKEKIVTHNFRVMNLTFSAAPPPAKLKMPPQPKIELPKVQEAKIEPPRITLPRRVLAPEVKPIQIEAPKPKVEFAQATTKVMLAPHLTHAFAFAFASTQQQPKQTVAKVNFGESLGAKLNSARGAVMATSFGDPNGTSNTRSTPRGKVSSAGFGGISSGSGARVSGHVASVGFGGPASGNGRRFNGRVASAGFDAVQKTVTAITPVHRQPDETQIEITYKPPVRYTAEAKQRKIQGQVILDVTFTASGRVIVNRVVSGLGFGLDEEARRVASEIRYHPATRDGHPVDVTTHITVTFQLA